MTKCKKCGAETGPAFGLCSACIKVEDSTAVRVQVAIYDILQVEFIAENYQSADEILASYWRKRYARGLPMGGANISHVDGPRLWNVRVGQSIPSVKE
jgi:hypothetical protein